VQAKETLWKDLTQRDFAFSPTLLAPPPAPFFKRLYLGMSSPQPYVWGSAERSRLGNASDPRYPLSVRSRRTYIDTPAKLDITDGGMTWSENLQMDIVDAFQSISGTESVKAKDTSVSTSGKRRVAVVEMVAGGWSFTARDQTGAIYVWGESSSF
jgi:SCF-associated factor 1